MRTEGDEHRLHWDAIYRIKGAAGVTWYQPEARTSLKLIERLAIPSDAPTIDVGGGASPLVQELLSRGFSDLTVLDVSESALSAGRACLGRDADGVQWICAELLSEWTPQRRYGLWHDRAVFHFFVTEADKARYRDLLRSALSVDGVAIVATFAADGPKRCSGLPTARYGPDELVGALGDDFALLTTVREEHTTPAGAVQPFTWVAVQLTAG